MEPEADLQNLRTWPRGAHLRPDLPTYQPPPPPPEELPPPEPGALEDAAMAPEKPPPRLAAKPETPRSWKLRPEYRRGR